METPKLTLRVDLGRGPRWDRAKSASLRRSRRPGRSRRLGISYRRAWLLVDDMNNCFCDPVIETQPGGAHGATLTAFGQKLVERYRAIEADALVATREHLRDIEIALRAGEATRR
jgi:molybdate transport system regulatory protein